MRILSLNKSANKLNSFGMVMNGRSWEAASTEKYRFSINGQEKDDEIYGNGNANTAEYWEYDTRLGRRWNLDPKPEVGVSEYSCFLNNPILYPDPDGQYVKREVTRYDKNGHIKKWYQFWIKTAVKEISYTIHNAKMYYSESKLDNQQKIDQAKKFKEKAESKGRGEYKTWTGKIIRQKIIYSGDIEVIDDLTKVNFEGKKHDHLIMLVSEETAAEYNKLYQPKTEPWLGLGTINGNVMVLVTNGNPNTEDVAQTGIHEFLHNLGLRKHSKEDGSLFRETHESGGTLKTKDLKRLRRSLVKTYGKKDLMEKIDKIQKK